jgi:hypothetical protein
MKSSRLGAAAVFCSALALLSVGVAPAEAQMPVPPPSPEAADIAACLCLKQSADALGATMADRQHAYDASRQEVAGLDSQLQSARMSLNVDNPEAVAQYRQLLDRRDAAYRRSSGALFSEFRSVVARYNARIGEYNARCADRPRNPILLSQVQATLVCPPPY